MLRDEILYNLTLKKSLLDELVHRLSNEFDKDYTEEMLKSHSYEELLALLEHLDDVYADLMINPTKPYLKKLQKETYVI